MKSMTGYGAAEGKVGQGEFFVEIRSVNHRYCDIALKVPPKLHVLDSQFRQALQSQISRGKVELFVKERVDVDPTPHVELNMPLARAYEKCLRQIEKQFHLPKHQLLDVVALRELVAVEERPVNYERYWRQINMITQKALRQLDRMRRSEGAHLKRDQLKRLQRLQQLRQLINKRLQMARKSLRAKFRAEQKKSMRNETVRNHQEALGAALDRIDITEELTRLQCHLTQYRRYMSRSGAIGRQLDFLIQEMNREINTMGSKAGDAQVSQAVVDAKSELEKLREQAQNIE